MCTARLLTEGLLSKGVLSNELMLSTGCGAVQGGWYCPEGLLSRRVAVQGWYCLGGGAVQESGAV